MKSIHILGIDPGLRNTGWGLILQEGNRMSFVASGVIKPAADMPLAERLCAIHNALNEVIAKHHPDEAAVEETFVNKDAQSTLKLGQARGIALLTPAMAGLPVAEYSANKIKKTVVGVGHAQKDQVMMMVKALLPKAEIKSADAADALAIAICHAQHRTSPIYDMAKQRVGT